MSKRLNPKVSPGKLLCFCEHLITNPSLHFL
jgi:hypothetical protein